MPPDSPDPASSFFAELKKRRVPQTALWYTGGAVALVQAAHTFLPSFGAPDGVIRFITIAAAFGLPIAVTLAWTFDVSQTTSPAHARKHRWLPVFVLLGVAVVSVAGAWMVWTRASAPAQPEASKTGTSPDPTHIAVLPFTVVGGDENLAAFASHLQTRLIDGLSLAASSGTRGSKRLRVVSYASILPFSRGTAPIDSIRESLDVGTLLDGTVEGTGDAVRVTLRLIDTQSGEQLAARIAEARANDRVALLDAVADTVIRLVRKELGTIMRERVRWLETRNGDAFDLVLWANQRSDEFRTAFTAGDYVRAEQALNQADSLFAEAERLDPQWIEPILERARQTERRIMLGRARGAPNDPQVFSRAFAHTERALEIRPGDPRALQMRGYLQRLQLQIFPNMEPADARRIADAAERDLRASLVGNYTPAKALRLLSELAGDAGRLQEAIDYGNRALDEDRYLEQVEFTHFRLFEYSFALNHDADAARFCAEGRARFRLPIFDDCTLSLAAWSDAYPMTPDSAWKTVEHEVSAYPPPLRPVLEPRLHALAAAILARAGQRDSALAVLRRAQSKDSGTGGFVRAAAGVYGLLGMADTAFATLRRLPAGNTSDWARAPELRSLRSDARFQHN